MKAVLQQSNIRFTQNLYKEASSMKSGSEMQKQSGLQNMCESGSGSNILNSKTDRPRKKTNFSIPVDS